MIVLALDTAGGSCGVALVRDGRVLASRLEVMARGQAEALVPLVEDCLAEASLRPAEIGLIGVTVGPGAFTGLRLGLAAAGGYALALGCSIVGVTTLECHAAAVPAGTPVSAVVAAVDSRREEPFVQAFAPPGLPPGGGLAGLAEGSASPHPLGSPLCRRPPELAEALARAGLPSPPDARHPVLVVGDAAGPVAAALSAAGLAVRTMSGHDLVDPAVVGRLAAARAAEARPDPPPPLYLRAPDAIPAPPPRPIRA